MKFRITHHAESELNRRKIPRDMLEEVFAHPQQIVPAYGGRKAYQSKFEFGDGRIYLLRAIIDDRVDPAAVVTVYRTSKIERYWSTS